jgi:hypothetical protein
MAEARGSSGMPQPDYEVVESFEPLPGEDSEPAVWRELRHGLNSMDLLVDQKLGGENERGEVEWIANEVLLVRLTDPDTLRVRWDVGEVPIGRFGLSNPRVRLTIWRW